jgi:acyl carrier protein
MVDETRDKVIKLLLKSADVKLEVKDLKPEMSLREDLGLDSLAAVELLNALEDEFKIVFDDAEVLQVKTLGDIYRFIDEKRSPLQQKKEANA